VRRPLFTELPTTIALSALNQTWAVQYIACGAKLEMIQRPQQELVLVGKVADKARCLDKLLGWVREQAHTHLLSHIQEISQATKLHYTQVTIRGQQTRWGSCTSKKTISLNYKLIFLPLHLVKHVLIHELCHTQHLNHSRKFWSLVAEFDPAWQEHRRELRQADQFMPKWL
jgi:predicted metal-dependent hydrolase